MAANTPTHENTPWTSTLFNHSVAAKAWLAVAGDDDCTARGKVARAALEAQAEVYATPAPTLGAVRTKLSIWWGEELYADGYESSINRIIMGDLTRLELEGAGATELEASGRSPEEAAAQLAEWHATLADYNEQAELFVEGPSDRWQGREAIEIINAMDYSAGVLFELRAPNIYGVIRKLELLWEDERFQTVGGGTVYVQILRDLHRLTREIEAAKADA